MGRVPVLVIDEEVMTESAAICLALCDRFPETGLAPDVRSLERALFYQWVVYAVATMEPPFDLWWFSGPSENEKAQAKSTFMETAGKIIRTLESALEGKPYLLGERFTAADIMVGSMMVWGKGVFVEHSPRLREYFDLLRARPACVRSRIFAAGSANKEK